jgi:hypothetical protein
MNTTRSTRTAPHITEEALQDAVVKCARLLGWRVHHAWLSLHSAAGYPDLTLVWPADGQPPAGRPARLLFLELKTARGRLSAEQEAWGAALAAVGGPVAWRVIRPRDWLDGTVERLLRGEEGTA